MDASAIPIPPATIEFLVRGLAVQAEVHLGLLQLSEEKTPPNLPMARHAIDLLAMLQEKTRGNLTLEEQRVVENTLTELRFRYIQVESSPHPEVTASAQS